METHQDPYPSFSVDPDFHSPELSSYYPCPKIHRFPVEIFNEIFLYTVQADPRSRRNLMLVCRHWHRIMLSTPGIHSQLRIHNWTKKRNVERFGRRWLLDVTININNKWKFDPVEFNVCFMVATKAASRWRSLAIISLPPLGECKGFQITHSLQHLESFKLAASCELGNFLDPLITAIATAVTSRFTAMEVFHPDAALYFVQPAHFQIFSSLTTLRLNCRRIKNPVDILPSLHKLEILEAHHLPLPVYPPAVDLPLIQILRVLRLKSVSVQWIAGRILPALEECSIIFPQHADAIRSVYMPSCSILTYHSNKLDTLEHFHHPPLARLEVKCGQWRTWSGNRQLATLHPIFATRSLSCLHLEIKCSERLLAYMLGLLPALEELRIGLSSPHALRSGFFLAFAARARSASAGPISQAISPLCRQLRMLHLHYKRWSRGAERNALIPTFGAIVASHPRKKQNFSFRLSFSEETKSQEWKIHKPVERFDIKLKSSRTYIGIPSPHGVVLLSCFLRGSTDGSEILPLLPEAEYITTNTVLTLPIDYLFSHHCLKEVRMIYTSWESGPNTPLSANAPLFHNLKILGVSSIPPSFLTGQTFHKLERYQERWIGCVDNPGQDPLTEMPVCTRLIVPLSRLATLKLPQICELVVSIDHEEPDYLWEQHIAVHANLSGLKLLGLCVGTREWSPFSDITKTLRSLPALEILVLSSNQLRVPYLTFFEALIPMNAQGTPGLHQSRWEGQISGVLCPSLESLQIEDIRPTEEPGLMPVLKDIVLLRAITGSPLKSLTFYYPGRQGGKWQLIGKDRSFIMEAVVPAQRFRLDI